MTDRYTTELGRLKANRRYALAVMDACRASGFPAMLAPENHRLPPGYDSSSYVSIPHSSGVATIRISNHQRPEAAARRHGPVIVDLLIARETVDEAAALAIQGISGLQPPDGAFCRERLPAAFCGRMED